MIQLSTINVIMLSVFAAIGILTSGVVIGRAIMFLYEYKETIKAYHKLQQTMTKED